MIPLPEAEEYQVKIRHREAVVRAATPSNRDYTRYAIITPEGSTDALPKRQAVLEMVRALHARGVPLEAIRETLTPSKFQVVPGPVEGQPLSDAWQLAWGRPPDRYFADHPFHEADKTYLLTHGWGPRTPEYLTALAALSAEVDFEAVDPA